MKKLKRNLAVLMSVSLMMSQVSAISFANERNTTASDSEAGYELVLDCDLEQERSCGEKEHTHTDSCYGMLTATDSNATDSNATILECDIDEHEHDEECYTVHEHDENCYVMVEKESLNNQTQIEGQTPALYSIATDSDAVAVFNDETYETLKEAVAEANKVTPKDGEANVITLREDIELGETLTIKKDITIEGDAIITRTTPKTIFAVDENATLTLDGGLVVDGNNDWDFDSEGYYADMEAGLTLTTGAKNSYTASEEGGLNATNPMISISGTKGAVVMNAATIQNNYATNRNDGCLFGIPAGATLNINEGAMIKHIHSSVAGQIKGTWNMNGGTIDDVYGHSSNGGVVDLRGGVVNVKGGEITNIRTLGLNANGNGIFAQVHGENSKLNISGGHFHDNASFAPGGGWGAVLYSNSYGKIEMTGGVIERTLSDKCSAFAHKHGSTDNLLGGTIVVEPSLKASFDSLFYGCVTIGEEMNIVGKDDALFSMLGDDASHFLLIDGNISGGTVQLAYNKPITGEGTVTSDVLIKTDNYLEFDGNVTIDGANWLDSVITVDSVGTDASLTVKQNTYIDGTQVRILDSVPSGDYTNAEEFKTAQEVVYVQEDGATVESPVLYYHRLTAAQKKDIVVTFDYNGGLDASGWSGSQITSESAFTPETLPAPTKGGISVLGWAYAEDNDPESLDMTEADVYNGETITSSVRLIALWDVPSKYVCYIEETGVYYETLTAAVNAANASAGDDTIVMIKNIDFDSNSNLTINGNVTIKGQKTISRGAYTGTLFTVPAGSSLTLDGGIVFDGSNNWTFNKEKYEYDLYNFVDSNISTYAYSAEGGTCGTAAVFVVKGTMNAKDATIRNFFNTKDSNAGDGAIFKVEANAVLDTNGVTIDHVATYGANAVAHLSTNSKWYIKGDTMISNNFAGRNGGICRNDSGQIYMSGGTIKNTAGKNVNGTVFMMYDRDNHKGSQFIMTGGMICSNSSVFGINNGRCAAVYLHENAYMQMTGGTICHNVGGSRGGIDSYKKTSVLDINRADQQFDNAEWNESGAAAYTADNHPYVIDNVSLIGHTSYDVGHSFNFDTWWVTGGIYTQDVDEFCAEGYVCIPYTDNDNVRTDDYIVVPGYRVNYYSVETVATTDAEATVEYNTTLVKKYFHLLPRDQFWYQMDERADYYVFTDDSGHMIDTWYTEKELVNLYDFENTKLESDLDVFGKWVVDDRPDEDDSDNGNETPGGENGTPGGENETPGGENGTPGGENETPGGENGTPGGENGTTGGGGSSTDEYTISRQTTTVVIDDNDTPLGAAPEGSEDPAVGVLGALEILDDMVPLGVLPATGTATFAWLVLSALSAAGLLATSVVESKKRKYNKK